ncbi:MAG: MBL fold metallo-hydrolase [Bacteroidales bacterium]|nr:MBL fold metallo-hydrolase [Bacteroidales bacterium]
MKRRKFLQVAAAASLAAALDPLNLAQAQIPPGTPPQGAPRGGFPSQQPVPTEYIPTGPGIQVRFLGTGAADWRGPASNGELRRNASMLADRKVLFDFTATAADMVPAGVHPEVIFYTHSHSDHYDPKAALALGIKRVYLGDTWVERAKEDFRKAAEAAGGQVPEIIPLAIGQVVEQDGLTVTALPANHASNYADELALIYLIEKDSTRLLYATDTSSLTALAVKIAGLERFDRNRRFLTGIIMESTMGIGYQDDAQMFAHSSVDMVGRVVKVLTDSGKYLTVPGQKVWLTHISKSQPAQAELDRTIPDPLRAAYDGLEVVIR